LTVLVLYVQLEFGCNQEAGTLFPARKKGPGAATEGQMASGNGATIQNDLREFITAVEKRGELAHVKNAH